MARILVISGDGGGADLDYAMFRMREEGFEVTLAAPRVKRLHILLFQQEEGWDTYKEMPWYAWDAEVALDEVEPSKFDGLLLPGGRAPWYLRTTKRCLEIVRHFIDTDKPIAAIDRGPLILLDAGLKGRRLTGSTLIGTRVPPYGCTYLDARGEAVVDGNIVTVTGRPYHHVWIREFLSLLNKRPQKAHQQGASRPPRMLILICEGSSSGYHDYAYSRMLEEGFDVTVAAPIKKTVRTVVHMPRGLDKTWDTYEELPGLMVEPDASFDDINPSEFAGLVVGGGRGPENMRVDIRAVKIVHHFLEANKPMTFACHGPQLLTEALVQAGITGKRLTGEESMQADVLSAGCTWVFTPGEPVTDGNIVTAWRRPDYDVWMRGYVALLRELGIAKRQEPSARGSRPSLNVA
jgi:putative intracellular protease/amidase